MSTLSSAEPAPLRASRWMLWGQHLVTVVPTVVAICRAVAAGEPVLPVTVVAAVLVTIYLAGSQLVRGRPTAARWWLVSVVLVWVAAVLVSVEFIWVAFALWLLAGHLLSWRLAVLTSAAIYGVVVAAPWLHEGQLNYPTVVGPLIGAAFAVGGSRAYLQLVADAREREKLVVSLRLAHTELADLQDDLARSQRQSGAASERTRIARDLHDTVAQGLSSIRLLSHAAAEATPDDGGGRSPFVRIEELASSNLIDLRRIMADLAPAQLDDDALAQALRRLLVRLTDQTGIATELHVEPALPPLTTEHEVALLRAAQSGLANVAQHSQADKVVVSLIDDDDRVRLELVDNGVGFDGSDRRGSGSVGLAFLADRLRELGGSLIVDSEPGRGTALVAELPLVVPRRTVVEDAR